MLDHLVLFLDLSRAELLDLVEGVLFFAALLHARKFHCHSVGDPCLEVIALAVDAEPMAAFESKEVLCCEFQVADITVLACAFFHRFSNSINEVLIKALNKLRSFFFFLLLIRSLDQTLRLER